MPLNGPIQADGQELKAAHTQKALGGREGSSTGFAHGKGGCPTTKGSVEAPLRIQWHPLGANCTAPHAPKGVTAADSGTTCRRLRGPEAIKIQQTTCEQNTFCLPARCGSGRELMGASVCLPSTRLGLHSRHPQ